jgi:peptidyl-prolyl cis-trans isomerase D
MLRGLRKASSNWLGKIVMAAVVGFLIISFGIWGIGDMLRGFTVSFVAKVGRSELSIEQFRSRYYDQLKAFERQIGRPVTPGIAQAMGLDQQVLGRLVTNMALDERARQLRLNLSSEEVTRLIKSDPTFRGPTGQFDPGMFLYRIREAGYTEPGFVAEQRRDALRRQIIGTIATGLTPPRATAEMYDSYQGEERSIDYVQFDAGKVGEIPAPTPEELASYFEAHKAAFRAPEYRKIQLLTISQADIAATIEVGEDDAKRIYQDRKDRFGTPERRHVMQISFANADEAKRASERIAGGLSFDDLAKEPGIRMNDLGTVTKSEMVDRAAGDAAFSLAQGAVSGPVAGKFGPVILKVSKIEPASIKPFAEVEAELKREIAAERAKDEVNKIRDKIEEELGGSARLEEIAQKLNLKLRTIEAVDRSGRTPEGEQVKDLPAGVDVVNSAFGAVIGNENEALQLPAGGLVWYDVVSVTPSRERPLSEVKDKVETRLRSDETTKRLNAKTAEILGKLRSGTALADVAAAEGLKVETKSGLKRRSTQMPPRVINEVFRLVKDQAGGAEGEKTTERVVFRVTGIKKPAFDPESAATAKMLEELKSSYNEDIARQYMARLEKDIGVDINQKAVAQVVGRSGTVDDDSGGGGGY